MKLYLKYIKVLERNFKMEPQRKDITDKHSLE